jgi:hypothetical protein
MTDDMLDLARANAAKAGATNVEFLKGEIEAVPLPESAVDVVIFRLRDQPVHRQARDAGRDVPRSGARRPDRHLRATGSSSGAVCGLRSGAAVRKDAELVPLWVGKYDPALIALADVGVSST